MRTTARFNAASCLCAAVLSLILFFQAFPAVSADRSGDEFLAGYVASVLERDLGWEKDSYRLKVAGGVATIILFTDDPVRRDEAEKQLGRIDGLQGVTVVVSSAAARPGWASRFLGLTGEREAFPVGDLFRPLLADPKQPQFFMRIYRLKTPVVRYTVASIGFGETFGLYRFLGLREGDGLQLNVEGSLFAQFNLNAPSSDLINADYTLAFPVTYRNGDHSLRFRIYHQSSHLGDELLLSVNSPLRVNLSYEAVELIYSREWGGWRVYGGGEYLIRKEPADLKPAGAHWGIEYLGRKRFVWNGRLVGGVDMKSFEEHEWDIDTSVKVGLEFGRPNPGQRRLQLVALWYRGFDPRGQFYTYKVEYYGLGVSLGF